MFSLLLFIPRSDVSRHGVPQSSREQRAPCATETVWMRIIRCWYNHRSCLDSWKTWTNAFMKECKTICLMLCVFRKGIIFCYSVSGYKLIWAWWVCIEGLLAFVPEFTKYILTAKTRWDFQLTKCQCHEYACSFIVTIFNNTNCLILLLLPTVLRIICN